MNTCNPEHQAANDDASVKDIAPLDGGGLVINASGHSMVSVYGNNTKHVHPVVVFMILFFAFGSMYVNTGITARQAANYSALVRDVAACEQKTPNDIHREMRSQYDYGNYKDMNKMNYMRAGFDLTLRKCSLSDV